MSAALYPPESVSWSPERRAEVLRAREALYFGAAADHRLSLEEVEREARRVLVVLRSRLHRDCDCQECRPWTY